MEEEKLKELLNELAKQTTEPARPGLAEDIKHQIPHRLMPHRAGMDTINVLIDLRISKLAAAAAIIITILLCANFFGGRALTDSSVEIVKHYLGWRDSSKSETLAGMLEYENPTGQGRKIVYYSNGAEPKDGDALLAHWKLSDDRYRVFFTDFRTKIVSAEELIKLQAQMLQKKAK